jgi:methionyl-tRNA synthetase
VKVPVEGGDGKVLYVWLDAPIGYLSATKQWAIDTNKDWREYWTGDRKLVHFIGKDNIVFHAIIFPILLKAHEGLILPDNIPAYEFLNLEGDKFSTSRNWAVWLHEYIESYPDKIDELKYVLTGIAPESKDSEFTWKEYQTRVNSELADILGNFVNRSLVLTQKYYTGIVPEKGEPTNEDNTVLSKIKTISDTISNLVYAYKLREAQAEAMNLARIGNKYLADTEPWKLIKSDPERVSCILNVTLQITANLSIVLQPFLPATADKISEFINFRSTNWQDAGRTDLISVGHKINKPHILFPKIDDQLVEEELEKLSATKIN